MPDGRGTTDAGDDAIEVATTARDPRLRFQTVLGEIGGAERIRVIRLTRLDDVPPSDVAVHPSVVGWVEAVRIRVAHPYGGEQGWRPTHGQIVDEVLGGSCLRTDSSAGQSQRSVRAELRLSIGVVAGDLIHDESYVVRQNAPPGLLRVVVEEALPRRGVEDLGDRYRVMVHAKIGNRGGAVGQVEERD